MGDGMGDREKNMNAQCNGLSVDEMLPFVGEFQIYQKLLCFITSLVTFAISMQMVFSYFASLPVTWSCVSNSTLCPMNGTFSESNTYRCTIPRTEWRYNAEKYYSMTVQYDLPCGDQWLVTLVTSTFFVGMGLGAIVVGWIADNYGRKKVIIPCIVAALILGFVGPFVPSIHVLILVRFLVGFVYPGAIVQMWILLSESVGNKKRPLATAIPGGAISLGFIAIGVKAYFLQNWKHLSIACTAPYILVVIPAYFFVPESARWLHLKNRPDKAMKILHNIAKWNKKEIPHGVQLSVTTTAITVHQPKSNMFQMFQTKTMAFQTCVQMFLWMATSLTCFGFTFAADHLGGSLYVNFVLMCLVGFPALSASAWMCSRFGRKIATVVPALLSGLTCIAIAAIPSNRNLSIAKVVLGILGSMCGSTTFTTIYVWTPELYATKTRSLAMGFMQVSARVGAIVAPWIMMQLSVVGEWIPFVVVGTVSLVSAGLGLLLPETKGLVID